MRISDWSSDVCSSDLPVFETGHSIVFAHTNFKWANLASHNAGVTVVIVGISRDANIIRTLYSIDADGEMVATKTDLINAYLISGAAVVVNPMSNHITVLPVMARAH